MTVVCPSCSQPIEAADETAGDVVCPSCGSQIRRAADVTQVWEPDAKGRVIGKFQLLDHVGSGAFGNVYKARDPDLNRIVAIKVPRAGNLASGPDLDRFLREARSVAQLRHPSIVPVHEVGQVDKVPYLVSEFVQGVTLADKLTAGRLGYRQTAEIVAAVAEALQYAHDQGIIHRDVKPSNIMLDDQGRPHLMDFGLAKRDGTESVMTVEGQVLGTPAYMSPEQASGTTQNVDRRSDVYSLGVILFQMLTGRLPFQGNARILLQQVQFDDPPAPRSIDAGVPRELETISLTAMAKLPSRRYASAGELAADLRRFLAGELIHARPPRLSERFTRWMRRRREVGFLAIGFLVAVVFFVVVLALRHEPVNVSAVSTSPRDGTSQPVKDDEPAPVWPPDLALVTEDAFGFASFRTAELARSESMPRLRKLFGAFTRFLGKETAKEMQLDVDPRLLLVDRSTYVMAEPWTFDTSPVVLRNWTPEAKEYYAFTAAEKKQHNTWTYTLNTGPAAADRPKAICWMKHPGLFLEASDENHLVEYLDRLPTKPPRGALREALTAAASGHQVTVSSRPPGLLLAVTTAFGSPFTILHDVQYLTIVADVRPQAATAKHPDVVECTLTLTLPDETKARKASQLLEEKSQLLRQALAEVASGFASKDENVRTFVMPEENQAVKQFNIDLTPYNLRLGDRPEMMELGSEIFAELSAAAQSLTFRAQGRYVVIGGRLKTDFARLGTMFDAASDSPRVWSLYDLYSVGQALRKYHTKNKRFPPPAIYDKDGRPLLSWRVAILPFLGEAEAKLYEKFKLDEPWDSEHNRTLLADMPSWYASKLPCEPNTTCVRVISGAGTAFEGRQGIPLGSITDGHDQTILAVEAAEAVQWTKPDDLVYAVDQPLPKLFGRYPDGFHAVFCDGSARLIRSGTTEQDLRALITRGGGEEVDLQKLP